MTSKRIFIMTTLIVLLIVVVKLPALYLRLTQPVYDLPDFGQSPQFTLTDSNGATFNSTQMIGKVWVADFFFTSCQGPCPIMTRNLHTIYQQYLQNNRVGFVSISIDPEYDTPQVLSQYAKDFQIDPQRWHLLTGNFEDIIKIARDGFLLGADAAQDINLHSTRFVLIDSAGHIRGYYTGTNAENLTVLKTDIDMLLKD